MKIHKLFKYRPINLNTLDSINKHYLYFSNAFNLNDPFDCRSSIHISKNRRVIKNWLVQHYEDLTAQELEERIDEIVEDRDEIFADETIPTTNQEHARIFSLSAVNNNILMWSHYAQSHQGICLEFKPTYFKNKMHFKIEPYQTDVWNYYIDVEGLLPVFQVKYSKNMSLAYDLLNLEDADGHHKSLFDSMKTKSADWSYEKEFRIIMRDNILHAQKIVYEKECLSGIIWGCQTTDANKELVMTIVNNIYPKNSVQYYDAKIVKGKYALEIIPICGKDA
jgi:hypothetical protein